MESNYRVPQLERKSWDEQVQEYAMNYNSEVLAKLYGLSKVHLAQLRRQQKTSHQDSSNDVALLNR